MIFNIITNIIVLLLAWVLYKKHSKLFFFFLPFIIQYVWMSFSVSTIESGFYITEQKRHGYFVGANFYLLIFFLLSIISFSQAFYFIINKTSNNLPQLKFYGLSNVKTLSTIVLTLLLLGLLNMFLSNNIYFDSNRGQWPEAITKFNFWQKSKFPVLKAVLGNTIGFLPFILGITFNYFRKKTIIYFILYLAYLIGIGQKFGPILNATVAFMMSFFVVQANRDLIKNRIKPRWIILAGALLFALVFVKYSLENPYDHLGYSVIESIVQRAFGLQAHVFWGVVDKYIVTKELMYSWDIKELNFGMHKLMEVFWQSPTNWLEDTIARGVSWTNGYPSILFTIVPWYLAYIIHTILFVLVGIIAGLVYKFIYEKKFFWATIFFQAYLWIIHIYTMSYFYKVYPVLFILITASLVSSLKKPDLNN